MSDEDNIEEHAGDVNWGGGGLCCPKVVNKSSKFNQFKKIPISNLLLFFSRAVLSLKFPEEFA